MALTPGTSFGTYEVTAQIGVGGMGEVYRARDTKLGREVALKVLPESFVSDPERVARFQREAKTLASLNHPNIAGIHGLEEANGVTALVMELVEGEDLTHSIARGAIALDEALPIARQIAEALEAAHEQGIVHRDLKPANIKVRPDGTVKVLDFGLAKAIETRSGLRAPGSADLANSPTITTPAMTSVGVLLGTAPYMAPEQARGRPVDRRADIWAFGCVVFEMLTGRRPFDGEDIADTLGAIIHKEPAWSALPASTPTAIRRLVQRCLEKDPKQRLRDIGDARLEIDSALRLPMSVETITAGGARASRLRVALAGWLVAAALGILAAAVGFVHFTERRPDPAPPMRFEIGPPEKTTLVTGGAISPDGRFIAFGARDDRGVVAIWLRNLDSLETRRLAGTDRNTAYAFFWSPDSRFIVYSAAERTLRKVDVHGGPPLTIASLDGTYTGGAWSRDNVVIFGLQGKGLQKVTAEGGTPSSLTTVDPLRELSHADPMFLPDGRRFLYTRLANEREESGVYVGTLDGSDSPNPLPLLRSASRTAFVPSSDPNLGDLLFTRGGTLMTQPFDAARVQLSGEAAPLAENVPETGPRTFSASGTGIVTFRNVGASSGSRLTWFDRQGNSLGEVGPVGLYGDVTLSPDGKTAVVSEREPATEHLWTIDLRRAVRSRLNPGNERDGAPAVSHDGRIVFSRGLAGDLYVRSASGVGDAELLVKSANAKFPGDWSSDGRYVIYDELHPSRRLDLWVLPLAGGRQPIPFLVTPAFENLAKFSPDGRWVAYVSDDSGRREVYVRDFAPDRVPALGSQRVTISTGGGGKPRWRRDGKEIYYIAPDRKMMAVPVTLGATFLAGLPVPLFDTNAAGTMSYDVSADGRFLVNTISDGDSSLSPPITVVINWRAALNK